MSDYWIDVILNVRVALFLLNLFSVLSTLPLTVGAVENNFSGGVTKAWKISMSVLLISVIGSIFMPSKNTIKNMKQVVSYEEQCENYHIYWR